MTLSKREKQVLDLITADPSVTIAGISEILGVSTVTVRANLGRLEDQGLVIRSRGGASPAFHPDILRRLKSEKDIKNRIAKEAANLVREGDTIMIEAGTTTALIAFIRYQLPGG